MKFFIKKIILWPKDTSKSIREIEFKPNKVNVLTGQSETGKSTIVWIIDYCLGASKCAIPVGYPIREKTAWFGLHIEIDNNEMLIARRNPDDKSTSPEVFIKEGVIGDIPRIISKNANTENLKNRLNELCRLPSLSFIPLEEGTRIGFQARPSIRDMMSFCFQPQHIVANPFALFYRADTAEHRERLKVIFPLALGAISNEHLFLRHELNELQSELRRLHNKLNIFRKETNEWRGRVESLMRQAVEFGLVKNQNTSKWNVDKFVSILRDIPESIRSTPIPLIEEGASSIAVEQLSSIREREFSYASELGLLRIHLNKTSILANSVESFGDTAEKNSERINSIGWFEKKISRKATCPLCDSAENGASSQLQSLLNNAAEFTKVTSAIQNTPAVLDRELVDTKTAITKLERQLNDVRAERMSLEDKNEELAKRRQELIEIYRFVGRLEQSLVTISYSEADSDISIQIDKLGKRIVEIEDKLDIHSEQQRLEDSLQRVAVGISRYSEMLNLERMADPIRLDIKELTLRISSGEREDFLWEIGSGKNHMGLHVSSLLSLHLRFAELKHCPVPSFLLFDQPSQVYFPEQWPEDGDSGNGALTSDEIEKYPEIGEVHKVFRAMENAVNKSQGNLQVIVTDHAGAITWKGLNDVHLVEEWRGDADFLIPKDWLDF